MENITPTPPAPSEAPGVKKEKYIISIIIFVLAVLVAYLAWYVNGRSQPPSPTPPVLVITPVAKEAPPSPEAQASLGGDIYTQSQNPVKDKIPESAAPVTNPIEGAYKNPFE